MPADVRVPFAALQEAFGVPGTVTIPDGTPVATDVVWILPSTPEYPSEEFARREPKRVLAISRDEIPLVPRGTVIVAAERLGDVERTWIVDSLAHLDADHTRVLVVPGIEET